jgi:hypothetical protein
MGRQKEWQRNVKLKEVKARGEKFRLGYAIVIIIMIVCTRLGFKNKSPV